MEDTRVVLIRPGDVLLISGVTISQDDASTITETFRGWLGIDRVAFFEDEIQIDRLSADALQQLATGG